VVDLDALKGSADKVFIDKFVNQVSTSTHVLASIFDAKE